MRVLWHVVWLCLYRPTPRPFHAWRRFLLRLFGATIEADTFPYPSARIWAPWNLTMLRGSCIADDVECYSVAPIHLGYRATVSQRAYLCTASHDYRVAGMPLVTAPIRINDDAWITACAYVGPGITVAEGAIVAACAVVVKDVPAWTVVGGNPAKHIKSRPQLLASVELKSQPNSKT